MVTVDTGYSVRDGGHYSAGIKHNGTLYISGQLSINPETGKPAEGGVRAEARQALENLNLVLQSAGIGREAVIQCHVYIPDIAYWNDVNAVYAEYFGNHKPARVVVPTGTLYNGCLVEIDAVAVCD